MKKIRAGIITLQSVNYGNRLQNYALQTVLAKLNIDVESINYKEANYLSKYLKTLIKGVIYFDKELKRELKRIRAFEKWNKKNIVYSHKKIIYFSKSNRKIDEYDYVITGSDQVWHPNMAYASLLTFVKPNKRISYAASFGVDELTKDEQIKYLPEISEFSNISVRERSGVKIVEEICSKKAIHVLDPTMLLSKDEWIFKEIKPSNLENSEYILIYSLGEILPDLLKKCRELANKENLQILNVMSDFYTVDPFEFIYLINHAKFLITDSFHGTVFSILLNTPFVVFNRTGRLNKIFTRIESLLEDFEIKNRVYDSSLNLELLMNPAIAIGLKEKQKKSLDFIKKSINFNLFIE